MLDITVSDPEEHGTGDLDISRVASHKTHFVDYKVTTSTDDPRFAATDFFVRRRYRDFVWLRGQLTSAFPGAIVPPLPLPDSLVKDDRYSSEFIQRRQAGLELFLRRVACHRTLSTSTDLLTFLEAKVWELQTVVDASAQSSLTTVLDGADSLVKRVASAVSRNAPLLGPSGSSVSLGSSRYTPPPPPERLLMMR